MLLQTFAPHGEFSFHIDGRILELQTRGPWNKELIEYFGQAIEVALEALVGAPWGVLATISEEGMHTPDSYGAMVEGVCRQRRAGRCATAIIFDHVFAEAVLKSVLERMYQESEEPVAFFEEAVDARKWLLEKIVDGAAVGNTKFSNQG